MIKCNQKSQQFENETTEKKKKKNEVEKETLFDLNHQTIKT